MSKDDMKFKIVKIDKVKQTIVLRPTLGTMLKFNIAAAGVLYCGYLISKTMIEDHYHPVITEDPIPETPIKD